MQLLFYVSCVAMLLQYLVVLLVYIFYTNTVATSNDDISILACLDEALLAAFPEQDGYFSNTSVGLL